MATKEITGGFSPTRIRLSGMAVPIALMLVAIVLAVSLVASRSTVGRLNRETTQLHTQLTASSSAVSALELQVAVALGAPAGRFERVREHVAARMAS